MSGHVLGSGAGHCYSVCGGQSLPAANLNFHRGRSSHGKRREAKLIVSVSFGIHALFKWKGKSCPDSAAGSCWLGHGDLLVMDGQCQEEFLHYSDPGQDQERINVTFRLDGGACKVLPFV